jgi:hypothetical protein
MPCPEASEIQALESSLSACRRVGAGTTLTAVGLQVLALVFVLVSEEYHERSAMAMLLAIALLFVAHYAGVRQQEFRQRLNRLLAREDDRGYFVCLRSFSRTHTQLITQSGGPSNPLPDATIVDNVVEELSEALLDVGFLFLIGSASGFDPWTSPNVILLKYAEDEWRQAFRRLAAGARAIFLIPETTDGLLEEMELVSAAALTHKTIVIMAPNTGYDSRKRDWTDMRSHLARSGWTLPEYRDEGMVYRARADFSPCHSIPFVTEGRRNPGEAIQKHLADLQPIARARDVIEDLQAREQR